jgi:hypothetical protein
MNKSKIKNNRLKKTKRRGGSSSNNSHNRLTKNARKYTENYYNLLLNEEINNINKNISELNTNTKFEQFKNKWGRNAVLKRRIQIRKEKFEEEEKARIEQERIEQERIKQERIEQQRIKNGMYWGTQPYKPSNDNNRGTSSGHSFINHRGRGRF